MEVELSVLIVFRSKLLNLMVFLGIFFVILALFGIFTNNPNIDSCIGLKKLFDESYIKFAEKSLRFKWLRNFPSQFSAELFS